MRSTICEEQRICRILVNKDVTMTFRKDKIYRIVFIWLNKENPNNLNRYLKKMKSTREKLGTRYIIEMEGEAYYHTFTDNQGAPDRVWIIKWPDATAYDDYLKGKVFQDNNKYFMSGVAKFHAYETTFK